MSRKYKIGRVYYIWIVITLTVSILLSREFVPLNTGRDISVEEIACEVSGTSGGGCFIVFNEVG